MEYLATNFHFLGQPRFCCSNYRQKFCAVVLAVVLLQEFHITFFDCWQLPREARHTCKCLFYLQLGSVLSKTRIFCCLFLADINEKKTKVPFQGGGMCDFQVVLLYSSFRQFLNAHFIFCFVSLLCRHINKNESKKTIWHTLNTQSVNSCACQKMSTYHVL